jgi:hypothetical protein
MARCRCQAADEVAAGGGQAQGLSVDAIVARYDAREVVESVSGIRLMAENGRGVPLIFEATDAPLLALQF